MQWLHPKGKLRIIQQKNLGSRVVCSAYDPETRSAFTGGWDMPVQEFKIGEDYTISLLSKYMHEEENNKEEFAPGNNIYWGKQIQIDEKQFREP